MDVSGTLRRLAACARVALGLLALAGCATMDGRAALGQGHDDEAAIRFESALARDRDAQAAARDAELRASSSFDPGPYYVRARSGRFLPIFP